MQGFVLKNIEVDSSYSPQFTKDLVTQLLFLHGSPAEISSYFLDSKRLIPEAPLDPARALKMVVYLLCILIILNDCILLTNYLLFFKASSIERVPLLEDTLTRLILIGIADKFWFSYPVCITKKILLGAHPLC